MFDTKIHLAAKPNLPDKPLSYLVLNSYICYKMLMCLITGAAANHIQNTLCKLKNSKFWNIWSQEFQIRDCDL